MKNNFKLTIKLFLLMLAISLAGCGIVAIGTGSTNRSNLMKINVGDSKAEVIEIMGQPRSREFVSGTEYLIYYTGTGLGDRGDGSYTPIALKDNKVEGWGQSYADKLNPTQKMNLNIKNE